MTQETEHNGVVAVEAAETSFQPTHRHTRRGTLYKVITVAKMQSAYWVDESEISLQASVDFRLVVVYQGEEGDVWVRPYDEFNDGRFEVLPTHKDARQLLADITAGLEGVTPGPWVVKTQDQWDAGFDFFEGPDEAFCFPVDIEELDAAHIGRCDPETMQAITYLVAAQDKRIAELEAERQWQPIETADKDAPFLLLGIVRNGVLLAAHIGTYCYPGNEDEAPCWWSLQDDAEIAPTHWMPLPASPHEGTQS